MERGREKNRGEDENKKEGEYAREEGREIRKGCGGGGK